LCFNFSCDSLELLDTIAETQITINLFLNNKFQLAEERMVQLADRSMYHALGYNTIIFIKAMMTCDKADLERSMQVSKDTCTVIERFRQKFSISETFLNLGGRLSKALTDAALAFFQDDNFASFIRGALRIRTCYQIYRYCERVMLDDTIWLGRDYRVREQFEAGVRLGLGTFNLMLSTLPSKVLRLLEVVGFSGDKVNHRNARTAQMCSRDELDICFIRCYYTCQLAPDRQLHGSIILFLRARLLLVSGNVDSAIYFFNRSIESQEDYKQFHHVAFWELLCERVKEELVLPLDGVNVEVTGKGRVGEKITSGDESRWSRCVYTYLLCILFAADTSCEEFKRNETVDILAKKIGGLRQRIAGKSIPLEKYCAKKANRFVMKKTLMFAHYEFMYFWNGFDIIAENTVIVQRMLEDLDIIWQARKSKADTDDRANYYFLRAVCLRNLRQPTAAESALQEVLKLESDIVDFTYLPPNAHFEMALLRIADGDREEAEALLAKARNYRGFPLENKLNFRIHSAMENLGTRTPMI
uniref:Tetratricopeptide repeat protein 39B n=1 Tax=Nippostrongylus brasiliensis TaxID=27835 RepID=A0A0N4Y712_NIPBR